MAEVSSIKVQAAALNMIADLSRNKRSASALEVVLKKVSGFVVGIACSSVMGLRDASVNALSGLACIDPDLIWLLQSDVYYSLTKKDVPLPPTSDFPEVSQVLSPPPNSNEYLYVQYGAESFGFDVDLGDKSHPQSDRIYAKLDELAKLLECDGYTLDVDSVFCDVEKKKRSSRFTSIVRN
ncbi:hypothetical protein NE237_021976 [Protea cynaroides]|uniref:Uncharacterized protein n=1 Tax=Protea cynaroides TaxID=273540 RepID=A0A9Q0HB82_9MAGN|nr:hypothetical protein NE237_021976 [Protea cynaroides]